MLPVRTFDVVDVDKNEAKNCAITDGSLPMTDLVIEQFSLYHASVQTIFDEVIENISCTDKMKIGVIGCVGPPMINPMVKQSPLRIASVQNIHDGDIKGTSYTDSMLLVRTFDEVDVDKSEIKNGAIEVGGSPVADHVFEQPSLHYVSI